MKDQTKKLCIFASALALAIVCSVAVFAVADYDSASDPLISRSFLIKYINDNVTAQHKSDFERLDNRLKDLEDLLKILASETPPADGETGTGTNGGLNESTTSMLLRLTERLASIEEKVASLGTDHSALSGKYDSFKAENDALKLEIAAIKKQINEIINDTSKDDVSELKEKYNKLSSELSSLKNSTSSIKDSFGNITDSYVALQKEVYNLNETLKQLSGSDTSILADIVNLSNKMTEFGAQLNELITENMTFELVKLEKGDSILAKGSVSLMLQFGEAVAHSEKSELGTSMDFTDLTSGKMISDGEKLPLNHNIFIPGNGRTYVTAEGEHGIYVFVGGNYTVVKAKSETTPPESETTSPEGETSSPEGETTSPVTESSPESETSSPVTEATANA